MDVSSIIFVGGLLSLLRFISFRRIIPAHIYLLHCPRSLIIDPGEWRGQSKQSDQISVFECANVHPCMWIPIFVT